MEDLIDWLLKNEDEARLIYEKAAVIFKEDLCFSAFLANLAEDEALHVRVIQSARDDFHHKNKSIKDDILLDRDTRTRIDNHISYIKKLIESGDLSKPEMIEYILCAERSEWNNLFLYVVNSLKTEHPDFREVGPALQHHLRSIDQYMEINEHRLAAVESLRSVEPVWKEGILIAEDNETITELLAELLSKAGEVDVALDGISAFEKAIHRYYAVILSDIDMPKMDGITFLQHLEKFYKNVADRFIFMTGYPTPKIIDFCRVRNIPLLKKPFGLNELQNLVFQILDQNIRHKPLQNLLLK